MHVRVCACACVELGFVHSVKIFGELKVDSTSYSTRFPHLQPSVDAAIDLQHPLAEEHVAEEEGLVGAVLLYAAEEVRQHGVAKAVRDR